MGHGVGGVGGGGGRGEGKRKRGKGVKLNITHKHVLGWVVHVGSLELMVEVSVSPSGRSGQLLIGQ